MNKTYEIPKKALILASISLVAAALMVPTIAGGEDPTKQNDSIVITGSAKTVMIMGQEETQFVPHLARLNVGDTLVFINQDGENGGFPHTVVAVDAYGVPTGEFESGLLQVGQTYEVQFTEPGVYRYVDSIHPQIRGMIAVT
jgi:plastocyanin